MNYNHYVFLVVEVQNDIARVQMRRPTGANAASVELITELQQFWLQVATDASIAAIILSGDGRNFSVGGDIKHMAARAGTQEGFDHSMRTPAATKRLWQCMLGVEQPIIAAINGDALGFGANLALFCDITVMAADARIGDTHVKLGLVAGDGGAVIWPLLIGVNRAKDFLMRGKVVNGVEAQSIGLVNYCVPADKVLEEALAIATQLVALPKWAVRWSKISINKHVQDSLNLTLDASIAYEMLTMQTKDFGEAARAFVDKRKPKFTGE